MKLVAVSQRIDAHPDRKEIRDALDQRLISFLLVAGFTSAPVPNNLYKQQAPGRTKNHEALDDWLAAISPEAILLSGGNNIGQYVSRDLTEYWLLDFAKARSLPVLGICRGMQMMAHFAGVSLHPVQGHVNVGHIVTGEITGPTNSYHDFSLATCPSDYELLAKSPDGEIEAIRHKSLPWEGWMWHPEREKSFNSRDTQRIKALFNR